MKTLSGTWACSTLLLIMSLFCCGQASADNMGLTGHIGGCPSAIAASGQYAYMAQDSVLTVFDMSTPSSPVRMGSAHTPVQSYTFDIAVSGGYAYMAGLNDYVQIMDIRDPSAPRWARSSRAGWYARTVLLNGSTAYFLGGYTLDIVDVSTPEIPTILKQVNFDADQNYARQAAFRNGYVYVARENAGLEIFDVRDPVSAQRVGTFATPGSAFWVTVSGSVAYVLSGYDLQALSLSDPQSPTLLGTYTSSDVNSMLTVSGTTAFVQTSASGVRLVGMQNPGSPAELGTMPYVDDLVCTGNMAYAVQGSYGSGLQVFDLTTPASPEAVGDFRCMMYPGDVAVQNGVACVVDWFYGIWTVNVADPRDPQVLGSLDIPSWPRAVTLSGNHAYVATQLSGLQIVDVANPTLPQVVGAFTELNNAVDVAISGDIAYIADGVSGLRIVDVHDPQSTHFLGAYDISGGASEVAVSGNVAYVAAVSEGLQIIDVSDPTKPELLNSYSMESPLYNLEVSGDRVFLPNGENGYLILGVSDPSTPTLLGSLLQGNNAFSGDIAVRNNMAYVCASTLRILDISSLDSVVEKASSTAYALRLDASDGVVYAAGGCAGLCICTYSAPPVADFIAEPTSGPAPLTVKFTDKSTAGGSTITDWLWFFGDGGTSTEQSPTHTYQPGSSSYAANVELAVYTVTGWDSETKDQYITVESQPPWIATGPQSQTVNPGQAVSFSVTATGTEPLNYEWVRNGGYIPDATQSSYGIASAQQSDEGTYTCRVWNLAGSVASDATLVVTDPPQVMSPPESQTANPGHGVGFGVWATGTGPLSYQWAKDPGGEIPGATESNYWIASAQQSDEGVYTCTVWNMAGTVQTSATLVVTDPPQITEQPRSVTVNPGQSASFNVTATGTEPLRYQWKWAEGGGIEIPGATQSSYSIASAQQADERWYECWISNDAGTVTSHPAVLEVNDPVIVEWQPQSLTVNPGESVNFSVTATGAWPLSYQWKKGTSPIPNATAAVYSLLSVQQADEGAYACAVTNVVDSVMSDAATLEVNDPVIITGQPQSRTVNPGQHASFSVTATGTEPLSYQWAKDPGGEILGATQATYAIAAARKIYEGSYTCLVSNMAGTVTSDPATLTVADMSWILRVDAARPDDSGDGLSWLAAKKTIQAAIDAAFGTPSEIWVKAGTYDETRTSDSYGSLAMTTGISLYGGFAGTEESQDARDWRANVTTISGANGRGAGIPALHTIAVLGESGVTVDGFTIRDGVADGGGTDNYAGGILNDGLDLRISNCVFTNHWAAYGGAALFMWGGSGTVTQSVFSDNTAGGSAATGAIQVQPDVPLSLTNCLFYGNRSNDPSEGGSAVKSHAPATTVITNCTFSGNSCAAADGGALSGASLVTNCILWNDTPREASVASYDDSAPTITYSDVQGGYSGLGNIEIDPAFVNAVDGDYHLQITSPCIDVASSVDAPAADLDGMPRPVDVPNAGGSGADSFDMGSYETPFTAIAPIIDVQPQSVTVNPGQPVSLNVTATGTEPLGYQWAKDPGGEIPGATQPTYARAAAQQSDEGRYTCRVWNVAGSVISDPAVLGVNDPVIITVHPQSRTVNPGASVSFSVTSTGTAPLSYQWKKGADLIPNATAAVCSLASAQQADEGAYSCVVANVAGSVASNAATLVVNDPPSADFKAAPILGAAPLHVEFTDESAAGSSAILSWQWDFGDQGTSSEANPSHTYAGPGQYTVTLTVTTDAGSDVESKAGYITATEQPTCTLTTSVSGGGAVDPSAGEHTYVQGTAATVIAGAYSGWRFDHWEGDATGSTNPLTINLSSNKTVTAVFAAQACTLTVSVEGQGQVDPLPGTHSYASGTSVTVTSTASSGWVFGYWRGALTGTINPATLVMNGNNALTAVFVPQPPASDVMGYVTTEDGLPLSGVAVKLSNAKTGADLGETTTNSQGGYEFTILDTEIRLRLGFSKEGFRSAERTGVMAPAKVDVVLLAEKPEPPGNIRATVGGDHVLVLWDPSPSYNVTGYRIHREAGAQGIYTTLDVPETQWYDTEVVFGETYYYEVTALDGAGNESAPVGPAQAVAGVIPIAIPDVAQTAGEKVRIPICVANARALSSYRLVLNLRYPAELVALESDGQNRVQGGIVVERTAVTAGGEFDVDITTPGRVLIRSLDTDRGTALVGEGHLFDLVLTLVKGVTTEPCGEVFIEDYEEDGKTRPGAVLYNTARASLTVDASRRGNLCVSSRCRQGDLNYDGLIDVGDVMILQALTVGLLLPDEDCQRIGGDLNGDGFIDVGDALILARWSVGIFVNPSEEPPERSSRITVAADYVSGYSGDEVEVPVRIADAAGVAACDLAVSFPPELELLSVDPGTLTADFDRTENLSKATYVQFVMSRTQPLAVGGGVLATLRFRVGDYLPPDTSLPIKLAKVSLKGAYGDSLDWYTEVEKGNGAVRVLKRLGSYRLTVGVQGKGTTTPSPGLYTQLEGSSVLVKAVAQAGWVFKHWEGAATGSENPVAVVVDDNMTLVAVFGKKPGVCGGGIIYEGPKLEGLFRYGLGDALILTCLSFLLGLMPRRPFAGRGRS